MGASGPEPSSSRPPFGQDFIPQRGASLALYIFLATFEGAREAPAFPVRWQCLEDRDCDAIAWGPLRRHLACILPLFGMVSSQAL